MTDDLRIFNTIQNFLANKLEGSKEEEVNNFKELWNAKRIFINDAFINYSRLLAALTGQGTGKKFYERFDSLPWPETTDHCQSLSSDIPSDLEVNPYLEENQIIDTIELFLSPQYAPPSDLFDLQDHLLTLLSYCTFAEFLTVPLSVAMRIDFAIVKIISQVERYLWRIAEHGIDSDKNIDRISKIAHKKTIIKNNNKQRVLELFYKIDTSKMKKHKIATTIKEVLEKEPTRKSLGVNTIKRYLIEEKCPPFG